MTRSERNPHTEACHPTETAEELLARLEKAHGKKVAAHVYELITGELPPAKKLRDHGPVSVGKRSPNKHLTHDRR